ncbi:hypothetical protein CRM22_008342 [Opisthorchis felineus]|uniref:Uncharacterized protein n=1 Tax=Opisthorchis felineus TaxID=147828 RepID=A0A4V3SDI9_OPIFE|nr:hypothetical protein CRM22_008342 [Opisthorchis felineus]TGZ60785.1 hypothetical protein CRM22_008342 [Opisthorchis felineus]
MLLANSGCGMICPRKMPAEALSSGDRAEDTTTQYSIPPPDKTDVSNNCDLTVPQNPIKTIEPCPKFGDTQSGDQQHSQQIDLLLQKASQYEERRQWENAIRSLESCLFLLQTTTNDDTDAYKNVKVSTAVRIAWLTEFCGKSGTPVLESWVHAMRLARACDEQKLSFVCARRVLHHVCCLYGDSKVNEILGDLHLTADSQEYGQYKGVLLNGIGLVYMRTGDYLKALNAFQNALNCEVHYSPNTRASLWQNLGTAHSAMGRHELAIEALITALKLYRQKSMYEGEAQACYNLGCVLTAMPSKNSLARWYFVLARRAAQIVHLERIVDLANKAIAAIDRSSRAQQTLMLSGNGRSSITNFVFEMESPPNSVLSYLQTMQGFEENDEAPYSSGSCAAAFDGFLMGRIQHSDNGTEGGATDLISLTADGDQKDQLTQGRLTPTSQYTALELLSGRQEDEYSRSPSEDQKAIRQDIGEPQDRVETNMDRGAMCREKT